MIQDRHIEQAAGRWRVGLAWAILTAALVAAFALNIGEMWSRWFPAWRSAGLGFYNRLVEGESYYTHGPLVPMVSLLIAVLLIRHTSIVVKPSPKTGFVVLTVSIVVHLVGCLARVNFVSGLALIGVLAGLVLIFWGGPAMRRLWFPIALLAFMVPLPEVSIAQINFRLKILATDLGVTLANVAGIVAERSANKVFLEGGKSLVVANVCNGLRTLISVLAFAMLYAYVCRLKGLWRVLLLAMAIPVAVASNALRILGLIVVANIWDAKIATGWFHDISGILIFVLAFLMMFGLEKLILWSRKLAGRPANVTPLFHGVRRTEGDAGQWDRMVRAINSPRGWTAVIVMVIAAGGAWWLQRTVPSVWSQQMARRAMPSEIDLAGKHLVGADMTIDERTLAILETRDYLYRRYQGAGVAPIDFCVVFSQDNRKGTHPPDLCLEGSGDGITAKADVVIPAVPGRGDVRCRELLVHSPGGVQYYLYTYKCGDRYTGSFWSQQLSIFVNGLTDRNASGALVRVSTSVGADVLDARARCMQMMFTAIPYLDVALR